MKNFGLSELVLVAPRCRIDDQARALASHAVDVLEQARVVDDPREAVRGCTYVLGTTARLRASPSLETISPRAALPLLPDSGGAVMFGPEDTGLENAHLDLCQAAVRIPTAEYASLNLAQAVNVIAYEWFLQSNEEARSARAERHLAPRDEVEPMIEQLSELLLYIGYTEPLKAPTVQRIYRGIFDRAQLDSREVAALRGLWSQVRWAANADPERMPGRRDTR